MLNENELQKLATSAARKRLPTFKLSRILTEPTLDSEGKEALRVVFVFPEEAVVAISAEDALKLLVDLRNELTREGDDRFPIIEYSTELDLQDLADPDDDLDGNDDD